MAIDPQRLARIADANGLTGAARAAFFDKYGVREPAAVVAAPPATKADPVKAAVEKMAAPAPAPKPEAAKSAPAPKAPAPPKATPPKPPEPEVVRRPAPAPMWGQSLMAGPDGEPMATPAVVRRPAPDPLDDPMVAQAYLLSLLPDPAARARAEAALSKQTPERVIAIAKGKRASVQQATAMGTNGAK